jgi:hypothetical protein
VTAVVVDDLVDIIPVQLLRVWFAGTPAEAVAMTNSIRHGLPSVTLAAVPRMGVRLRGGNDTLDAVARRIGCGQARAGVESWRTEGRPQKKAAAGIATAFST